jgi:hypothetical protein
MTDSIKTAVRVSLLGLLKPVVRLCIKAGLSVHDFLELLRVTYIRTAYEELLRASPDAPPTSSQISALTRLPRLSRAAIARLVQSDDTTLARHGSQGNRCERVIAGWLTDRRFLTRDRTPRVLPFQSKPGGVSFTTLVRDYSGDQRARTILRLLDKAGAVAPLPGGRVKLISRTVANVGWDPTVIRANAQAAQEHLETAYHNLTEPAQAWPHTRIINLKMDPAQESVVDEEISRRGNSFMRAVDAAVNHSARTLRPGFGPQIAIRYCVTFLVHKSEITVEPAPRTTRKRR